MRYVMLIAVALLSLITGCAGYKLGPSIGLEAGNKSVQIKPFVNNAPEPGLAEEVTAAVRKAVQRDGTYRLETHGDADLVVTGVINEYRRRELSLSRDDLRTVRDYQVTTTAKITIRDRAGQIVAERNITGNTMLRVGEDFGATERQAIPQIAKDLAKKTTDLLVNDRW
jgi:hypothetical protein